VSDFRLEKNSNAQAVPKRIAIIRREAPARLLESREEVVMTTPHLLVREVVMTQICLIVLSLAALFFDAPLERIADPSSTPNPAKAPWYFLGLQELLHYFPPVVAGVLLPALVVIGIVVIPYVRVNLEVAGLYQRPWRRTLAAMALLTALVSAVLAVYRVWAVLIPTLTIFLVMASPALPFCPARWRHRLSSVPLADWIMTWFVVVASILTLIGVLFRGPGWSWVWPWRDGIY
jgi:cytochrome b/b6/petD-like protein